MCCTTTNSKWYSLFRHPGEQDWKFPGSGSDFCAVPKITCFWKMIRNLWVNILSITDIDAAVWMINICISLPETVKFLLWLLVLWLLGLFFLPPPSHPCFLRTFCVKLQREGQAGVAVSWFHRELLPVFLLRVRTLLWLLHWFCFLLGDILRYDIFFLSFLHGKNYLNPNWSYL